MCAPLRLPRLPVPAFRSSCSIAAPTSTNFGKSWALENLLVLVPLFYLKFLDRIRGLRCRNFKQAAPGGIYSAALETCHDRLAGTPLPPLGWKTRRSQGGLTKRR